MIQILPAEKYSLADAPGFMSEIQGDFRLILQRFLWTTPSFLQHTAEVDIMGCLKIL